MNLPNKLTLLRVIMAPIAMVFILYPIGGETAARIIAAVLFVLTALTDMLDGKIARKYNLVTDFGKFLDPLADKFMVIGAMLCIFFTNAGNLRMFTLYFFALVVVVFRELAVTSIRLVASSSSGVVIAANWLGKIKTVTQIICVCCVIIEPLLYDLGIRLLGLNLSWLASHPILTYVSTVTMIVFTLWSGINYIVSYWKYLDPQK